MSGESTEFLVKALRCVPGMTKSQLRRILPMLLPIGWRNSNKRTLSFGRNYKAQKLAGMQDLNFRRNNYGN